MKTIFKTLNIFYFLSENIINSNKNVDFLKFKQLLTIKIELLI